MSSSTLATCLPHSDSFSASVTRTCASSASAVLAAVLAATWPCSTLICSCWSASRSCSVTVVQRHSQGEPVSHSRSPCGSQPADPAAVAQWRGRCHSHTVTQLHSHTFTRFRGNSLSPRLLEATRLAQSHCAVAVASG
eukprot:5782190-Pyramimonas_sp.AAC.1